jgi:uncharacterized protein YdaU (DUF1376 family)
MSGLCYHFPFYVAGFGFAQRPFIGPFYFGATMGKQPYFKFYPDDYIGGTMGFSPEQHGVYLLCLIFQHKNGHFSNEQADSITGNKFSIIKTKFSVDENGLFFNDRMEIETNRQNEYSQSRSKNRKNKTYDNHMNNICQTYEHHMGHGHGHSISSSLSSPESLNILNSIDTPNSDTPKPVSSAAICEAQQSGLSQKIKIVLDSGPAQWQAESNPALYIKPYLFATRNGCLAEDIALGVQRYASFSRRTSQTVCSWSSFLDIEQKRWLKNWDLVDVEKPKQRQQLAGSSTRPRLTDEQSAEIMEKIEKERREIFVKNGLDPDYD